VKTRTKVEGRACWRIKERAQEKHKEDEKRKKNISIRTVVT
jgi:hypothetical protein